MAKAMVVPDDMASLMSHIATTMVAGGWSDDGAPTATVMRSAADSEGRICYAKIRASAGGNSVVLEIGSSRSGDVVSDPASNPPAAKGVSWIAGKIYRIWASDRWVCIKGHGTNTEYMFFCGGILETHVALSTGEFPLFICGSRDDNDAANTISFGRAHSAMEWWFYDFNTPGFAYGLAFNLSMYSTAGSKSALNPSKATPRGISGAISPVYCHKPWFGNYVTPYEPRGYMKDAFIAYGVFGTTGYIFAKCRIGTDDYINPGYSNEASYSTSGGIMLMIKDS